MNVSYIKFDAADCHDSWIIQRFSIQSFSKEKKFSKNHNKQMLIE